MDEWLDNNRWTTTRPWGRRSYQTSLILSQGSSPVELPTGERVCRALVENAFWAWTAHHWLSDEWHAGRFEEWDAAPISFEPEPLEARKGRPKNVSFWSPCPGTGLTLQGQTVQSGQGKRSMVPRLSDGVGGVVLCTVSLPRWHSPWGQWPVQ